MYRLFGFIFLLLASCSNDSNKIQSLSKPDGAFEENGASFSLVYEDGELGVPEVIKSVGISYLFKEVAALDYLSRKGEIVSSDNVDDLKNESVFMLEFKPNNDQKEIEKSPLLKLSEDELGQYLIGRVRDDFIVMQNNKIFKPNASHSEGIIGNKIRVTFFFAGIDLSKKIEIEYVDRVFGNGVIKMIKTPNGLIS